jgi:hypothetical protein
MRLEPNLLLAITTALAMTLLVTTASVYGPPGSALLYVGLALICSAGYVGLNGLVMRRMNRERPPMIHRGAPGMAVWASLFPLTVILGAAIPVFWPGHDYGLLVIIGAIWFGVTVESALKARQP